MLFLRRIRNIFPFLIEPRVFSFTSVSWPPYLVAINRSYVNFNLLNYYFYVDPALTQLATLLLIVIFLCGYLAFDSNSFFAQHNGHLTFGDFHSFTHHVRMDSCLLIVGSNKGQQILLLTNMFSSVPISPLSIFSPFCFIMAV